MRLEAATYERIGENSSQASSGSKQSPSAELRNARELRYSRDEEALSARISSCTPEASNTQLQITALEGARAELETRIREYERQLHGLRCQLGNEGTAVDQARDSLLRQRLVIEHRLACSREEVLTVTRELERLRQEPYSPISDSADSTGHSESNARASANLSLFFQNSVTKRPLPKSFRPHSADYIHNIGRRGNDRAVGRYSDRSTAHTRSRSLAEDYYAHRAVPFSLELIPRGEDYPSTSEPVRAIDEFNNSFSSRVITPVDSKPRSSLRPLRTSPRKRRGMLLDFLRIASTEKEDYGTVTFLPHPEPRSRPDLVDRLPNTPLPSYVQNLMSDFDRVSTPPLSLSIMDERIPNTDTFQKGPPLSPVLEQPSPVESVNGQSPLKDQAVSKPAGRKLQKKQRSIFTLRLPLRPSEPDSSSRSTLAASSSTSVAEWTSEHNSVMPSVAATAPLQLKGLPSTRNHDLAMLDRAPDDIPDTPVPHIPSTPIVGKSRTSRPFAMLRRVKSRLVQLGRQ